MLTLLSISITCWLCALVAVPRRPRTGNEVPERVYSRLLGHQQRLMLLAVVVTGVTLLVSLATGPQSADADLRGLRGAHADCAVQGSDTAHGTDPLPCYDMRAGGIWERGVRRPDGSWQPTGTVPAPIARDDTIHGRRP